MRVLIVTKIFPNRAEPFAAPFNRQQFSRLQHFCDVEVLATIPWFPAARALSRWSAAGRVADVPARESIEGLEVEHPRTLFVPRFAPGLAGPLYVASLLPRLRRYRGKVDVVLGSWAYPDGFAAVHLARALGVPAVVKLHGSDVNVVARMPGPRRRLQNALPRAARIVAVSRQLGESIGELGVPMERVDVVPNGVDARLFCPRPRQPARAELGLSLDDRVVLYVGRLEESKGVLDLLDAFEQAHAREPRLKLILLGDGQARALCNARAAESRGSIQVLGGRPLAEVPAWLAACDLVCLPSWNEGMPNAVLEALASGRRVVGTRVGAIPDLISSAELGEVVERQAPAELAAALLRAASTDYDPARVAALSNVQSWEDSACALYESLQRALGHSLPSVEISAEAVVSKAA